MTQSSIFNFTTFRAQVLHVKHSLSLKLLSRLDTEFALCLSIGILSLRDTGFEIGTPLVKHSLFAYHTPLAPQLKHSLSFPEALFLSLHLKFMFFCFWFLCVFREWHFASSAYRRLFFARVTNITFFQPLITPVAIAMPVSFASKFHISGTATSSARHPVPGSTSNHDERVVQPWTQLQPSSRVDLEPSYSLDKGWSIGWQELIDWKKALNVESKIGMKCSIDDNHQMIVHSWVKLW